MAERDEQPAEKQPTEQQRRAAARARIEQQETWVDLQVRQAMERGEFDDLPGFGKPIADLGEEHDPEWWTKRLIERERISVVPPSIALRREDEALDGVLDRLTREDDVRREVADFNARVRKVLYSTTGWPPVVTRQRDPETEVERWRARRRR